MTMEVVKTETTAELGINLQALVIDDIRLLVMRPTTNVARAVVQTLRTTQAVRTPKLRPRCDFVSKMIVRMACPELLQVIIRLGWEVMIE
jgi:hypothetical protein